MKVKQVIVMRTDLNMRKGKMIAQGAHASMAVLINRGNIYRGRSSDSPSKFLLELWPEAKQWLEESFAKICVRADSKEELLNILKKAEEAGLPTALITDSGRTEFHGVPTITCCAIGPARSEDVDKVTGELKLL